MKVGQDNSPSKLPGGVALTQEFIVLKTRQAMDRIVKLNLWGNNLTDVSVLSKIPNLEVLALTVNQITSLKDFQGCPQLKELYLRRNQIPGSLQELRYLSELTQLKVLNLAENPISTELPHYRLMVLKHTPQLEKLDDISVTYQELQ